MSTLEEDRSFHVFKVGIGPEEFDTNMLNLYRCSKSSFLKL
jgi:hypothetical protein